MSNQSITRVTVLGAGVLGGQIAWHSAYKGKIVTVYDISENSLDACREAHDNYAGAYRQDLGSSDADLEATRERLRFTTDLAEAADTDLIIEAVPEIPEVKTQVYQSLANLMPAHTLVATNSSTLLPATFAEATGRPAQYCGLHFANLIWKFNLVEIMAHPGTSESTLAALAQFGIEIGMVPIPVQKEQNGYVLNTWFVALCQAAQTLITNGVSTPEYIDRTFMIANRGCSMGPCALIDAVGMKTAYDISNYWGEVSDDEQMRANARYIKKNFLDKGIMGLPTGQGYYTYPNPSFAAPDFLDVPDLSIVPEIVRMSTLAKPR
jgi:3-hydroxybutyryl-CoA dehydrogenase